METPAAPGPEDQDPLKAERGPQDAAPGPGPEGAAPNPPAENEIPGETDPAPQATRFEKIRAAGSELFERWGLKRGPGRPKNCVQCGLPETECQGHQHPNLSAHLLASAPGGGPPGAPVRDPLIIRHSITAIGKAARTFGDKIVLRKAFEASGDKEWAKEVRDTTSATDGECEALGEVTDILLTELGLDTKYLPLAAALVVVAGAGSRYAMTISDLNKAIRAKQAQEFPAGNPA
jgi:hypothetical protein